MTSYTESPKTRNNGSINRLGTCFVRHFGPFQSMSLGSHHDCIQTIARKIAPKNDAILCREIVISSLTRALQFVRLPLNP